LNAVARIVTAVESPSEGRWNDAGRGSLPGPRSSSTVSKRWPRRSATRRTWSMSFGIDMSLSSRTMSDPVAPCVPAFWSEHPAARPVATRPPARAQDLHRALRPRDIDFYLRGVSETIER
jgi:hypothetical protein